MRGPVATPAAARTPVTRRARVPCGQRRPRGCSAAAGGGWAVGRASRQGGRGIVGAEGGGLPRRPRRGGRARAGGRRGLRSSRSWTRRGDLVDEIRDLGG